MPARTFTARHLPLSRWRLSPWRLGRTGAAVGASLAGLAAIAGVPAPTADAAPALVSAELPASLPAAPTAGIADAAGGGVSYSLLTASGQLVGYGGAMSGTIGIPSSAVVGVAPTPDGLGAWVAEADGTVATLGDAISHGDMAGTALARPIVGIAADPATGGYWLVASDGGIFSFDAPFLGSTGGIHLNEPVVGMAATPTGLGYRMVAADGGVFDFGDATFDGSTGGIHLNEPVVGMTTTPDGLGYWMVASDGGIFTFGDAAFHGSTGAVSLARPIIAMAAAPGGGGYWLLGADGGIFTFGDASYYGSAATLGTSVVGMAIGSGGYQNPLRSIDGLTPMRVDQGVDYGGSGPVYAIGDGVVTNVLNSGWPGGTFISYRLVDGPGAGAYVYDAENITPAVQVGQAVTSSTVLGTLVNAYPNMETGWANPPGLGNSMASAAGEWTSANETGSLPTAYGENFSSLLAALGAPAGITGGAASGTLMAGWPTW